MRLGGCFYKSTYKSTVQIYRLFYIWFPVNLLTLYICAGGKVRTPRGAWVSMHPRPHYTVPSPGVPYMCVLYVCLICVPCLCT